MISNPFKTSIHFYILKCLVGLTICYVLYKSFPQHQFFWSMVSVLLVFAPDDPHGNQLAYDRMKANSIGSVIGLLLFLVHSPNLFMIGFGVAITILVGTSLNLGNATRSALASLLVVMIYEQKEGDVKIAFERMLCVIIGCLVALLVTFVFSRFHAQTDKP
jgi:uncharacterized membrane protein YgaE (UPF0421/DUF939 family)